MKSRKFLDFLKVSLEKIQGSSINAILVRGAGVSFVIRIVGTGLSFVTQVLLARVMGTESYGIYIYVYSWLSILLVVSKMGWDSLLLRYVAAFNVKKEWNKLKGILQSANRVVLFSSIALSLITAIAIWLLRNQLNGELAYSFWVACVTLPWLVLNLIRQAILRSFKRIGLSEFPETILSPILLIGLVGFVFFVVKIRPVTSILVLGLNLVSVIISFWVGIYFVNVILPKPLKTSTPIYNNRQWLREAFPILLMNVTLLLSSNFNVILIGMILGTTQAGLYSVASRIVNLTLFGISAVNLIAAPIISQLYASGEYAKLQSMLTLAARGICAYTLPVGLIIVISGKNLLEFFGSSFSQAYITLLILLLGQMINAMSGSTGNIMIMSGYQKEASIIVGISSGLNIFLNWVLIPVWGINGSAIANTSAVFFWNLAMLVFILKKMKINPTIFARKRDLINF